jgi:chitinase
MFKRYSPYFQTRGIPVGNVIGNTQTVINQNVKTCVFAFVISYANGTPKWSNCDISNVQVLNEIARMKTVGTVSISFGGATGPDLGVVISNVQTLADKIQSVIDITNPECIDFDVEGAAVGNTTSIQIRNSAIKIIQTANPQTNVSYTITGYPNFGVDGPTSFVITDAVQKGVNINKINLMTQSFQTPGSGATRGEWCIQTAVKARDKLINAGVPVNTKFGICPMLGQQDAPSTYVFDIDDAKHCLNASNSFTWLTEISPWVFQRDNQASSGTPQDEYEFANVFNGLSNVPAPFVYPI